MSPVQSRTTDPGGTGKARNDTMKMQTNTTGSNVLTIDWSSGKLVPITAAGLLPVGAVVTYEDRANPCRRYAVTAADFSEYGTGQKCTCEDGHDSHVSRAAINGPGGWSDTGERLDPSALSEFLAAASSEGTRISTERAQAEAKRTQDRATRRAAALAAHPYLEAVAPGSYSSAKLAAKNIRTQLKRAFPGVKFSVTSDTYSGGDSVDISWELGPTSKEVEAITGQYQRGDFNGMEDIYENNRENVWPQIFGGAKYVSENRHAGGALDVVAAALCDSWSLPKPADGKSWWTVSRPDDHSGRNICIIARQILDASSYAPGAVVTGIEAHENSNGGTWADHYRTTYTAPTSTPAETATPAATNGDRVLVRFNEAKNGIEIKFPTKPAAAVLDDLKRAGWRWARFSACWYQKASGAAVNAAARAAGLSDTERAALQEQALQAAHAAGARGMEEACGIA